MKASARKMRFRVIALDLGDHPLPKGKRFGVRIVYPEDVDALFAPIQEDALQFFPQLAPGRRFEVERVDVLVLLGRILRVLDRAIRPPAEPLRVFREIGMVARGLEGDIQRDLQPVVFGGLHQVPEVLERAQFGMDRLVSALDYAAGGSPDSPRAAWVARLGLDVVLLRPLRKLLPDGMDGRQVEDVEAHRSDVGQTRAPRP